MSVATAPAGSEPDETRSVPQPGFLRRLSGETATYVFLVDLALIVAFTLLSTENRFASLENLEAILRYTTATLLLALGLTMMMAAGIFDLSLGANLILSSVAGAMTLRALGVTSQGIPVEGDVAAIAVALVACLATGALFGLVNGLIISILRVNSLIATLGTLGVGTGLALVLTSGADIAGMPTMLVRGFGLNTVFHIPVPMIVALVLAVVLAAILKLTRFGSRTLAIGSNRVAVDRAGIQVGRHLVRLTILGGALAGLAGFVDLSQYGQTSVTGHALDGLNAATAVIIGGTALVGGRASMPGTIWGALLAAILLDGLIVLGVSSFYQQIVTGVVLIIAVALDQMRSRRVV